MVMGITLPVGRWSSIPAVYSSTSRLPAAETQRPKRGVRKQEHGTRAARAVAALGWEGAPGRLGDAQRCARHRVSVTCPKLVGTSCAGAPGSPRRHARSSQTKPVQRVDERLPNCGSGAVAPVRADGLPRNCVCSTWPYPNYGPRRGIAERAGHSATAATRSRALRRLQPCPSRPQPHG